MNKYINTEDLHKVVLKRKAEYGSLADLIDNIVEEMVKETPYADVVEKDKYDVLQSENKVLWHQLHQSCIGIRKAIDIILEKNLGEKNE